jgi:hypothetical protein
MNTKHIEQCTAEEVVGAMIDRFLSRNALYDRETGNLTIENVNITIQ